MPVSVTQTQTITVQAIFETVYTVYFCYEGRTVATKELTDTQPSVSTGDVLVPVGADEKLTGWYIGETRYETVSKADFLAGDTLTLTARVEKGHWIHFNSAGGSYVAPQFVTGNTIPPADPARPGFSFEGWYEESGKQFTFGNQLTSNITLTAHWRSNTSTKYTVIHWQEDADDDGYSYVLTRNGNKDRRDRRTDSGCGKELRWLHRADHHPADHQRRRLDHRQCLL